MGIVPATLTLTTVSASASLFAVPWTLLGLIVLLAAAGFGTWWLLRWRRRQHAADLAAVAEKTRLETERRLRAEAKWPASATAAAASTAASGSVGTRAARVRTHRRTPATLHDGTRDGGDPVPGPNPGETPDPSAPLDLGPTPPRATGPAAAAQ